MAKTKVPGKRLLPDVQAFIDAEFAKGKTATQVDRELSRLRVDDRQRRNRFGDLFSDDLIVSYRVIAERRRWWEEHQQAAPATAGNLGTLPRTEEKATVTVKPVGIPSQAQLGTPDRLAEDDQSPANYRWWWLDPDVAHVMLTAVAAWESTTGTRWGAVSQLHAETMARLARVAPGLSPQAIAAVVDQMERWGHVSSRTEYDRRMDVLGTFLGHRPWSSPEAAARYAQTAGSVDHFEITEDGLPMYVTSVAGTAIATGGASVNLTVGQDDEGTGHEVSSPTP